MDNYLPINPTLLSQYDNYEIYSLLVSVVTGIKYSYINETVEERYLATIRNKATEAQYLSFVASHPNGKQTRYENAVEASVIGEGYHEQSGFVFGGIEDTFPSAISTQNIKKAKYVHAFQTYHPRYQIDFATIKSRLDLYPFKQGQGWDLSVSGDYVLPVNFEHNINNFNWTNLIVSGITIFTAVATETAQLTMSYWQHNYLEAHPLVDGSFNYVKENLWMQKGKKITITLIHIVAETLIITSKKGLLPNFIEVSSTATQRPQNIEQYYTTSFSYGQYVKATFDNFATKNEPTKGATNDLFRANVWTKLYLDSSGAYLNGGQGSGYEWHYNGALVVDSYPKIIEKTDYAPSALTYQCLSATNDVWGNGVIPLSYPVIDVSLKSLVDVGTTFFDLFLKPQNDDSIGDLTMDSPRTIENNTMLKTLIAALSANDYVLNRKDVDKERVTTLGWYVQNIARVLGIRLDDNGEIDVTTEKNKYLPATLNNPVHPVASAYGVNCWGTQGMYVSFMPTTYNAQGKEEKLFDVIHDIPQLLNAKERALNASIGIQHGSQIRMRGIDNKVQSYPDQLALLKSMAYQIEKSAYTIQKLQIQITTIGMEVRDLYSGIGIPVSTKFTDYNDGTKTYQVPYIGYQKSKPGILNHLTDIKVNLGIINGVLMPKKQSKKTGVLNPFDVFNGKS